MSFVFYNYLIVNYLQNAFSMIGFAFYIKNKSKGIITILPENWSKIPF